MTDSNNITETNVLSIEKEEKKKKKKEKQQKEKQQKEKKKNSSKIKQENIDIVQENVSLHDNDAATNICNTNPKQLTTCDAFAKSITKNYKSWVCMFVAIYIVSKPNLVEGYFTFGIMLLFSYYVHKETHAVRNFFNHCTSLSS